MTKLEVAALMYVRAHKEMINSKLRVNDPVYSALVFYEKYALARLCKAAYEFDVETNARKEFT